MEKWTRKELKRRAKVNISNNYWLCVGVTFLMILAIGIGGMGIASGYWKIFSYGKRHSFISGSEYAYQTEKNKQNEDKDLSEIVLLHHYDDDHYYDDDNDIDDYNDNDIDDYNEGDDYDIDDSYEGDDYDIDDGYEGDDYDLDDFYKGDDYDLDDFYKGDDYDLDDFYKGDDYDLDDYYEGDDYDLDDYYEGDDYDLDDYNDNDYYHNLTNRDSAESFVDMLKTMFGIIMFIFLISFFISLIVSVFVYMPLQVGNCRFFMCNREGNGELNQLLVGFREGKYLNVVKIMFLRSLKIALWSMLFVIPGIIKVFEYSMIPYLLSEDPGMSTQEAFAVSKEMTNGEKWKMFVLVLSFIPWIYLGVFTLGLLYIFWLYPYFFATNAELYAVLREKIRFNNGRIVGAENLRYMYADGYQQQTYSNYTTQQQTYNDGYQKDNNTQNFNTSNDMYSNNSDTYNSGEDKTYRNTLDDFDKNNNPPKNMF